MEVLYPRCAGFKNVPRPQNRCQLRHADRRFTGAWPDPFEFRAVGTDPEDNGGRRHQTRQRAFRHSDGFRGGMLDAIIAGETEDRKSVV